MILNSKNTTLAYRCPKCGKNVFSVVGVFTLSGDMFKLKCSCGGSELTMRYDANRKATITVPCIVCSDNHSFTVGTNRLFGNSAFSLSCDCSGVDICFMGEEDAVIKATEKADKDFDALLKSAGVNSFEEFLAAKSDDDEYYSDKYPDPEMQSLIHFLLCELEDDGNIHCKCGKCKGHYEFKLVGDKHDNVLIWCTECSASVSIPLTDPVAIEEFSRLSSLKLT